MSGRLGLRSAWDWQPVGRALGPFPSPPWSPSSFAFPIIHFRDTVAAWKPSSPVLSPCCSTVASAGFPFSPSWAVLVGLLPFDRPTGWQEDVSPHVAFALVVDLLATLDPGSSRQDHRPLVTTACHPHPKTQGHCRRLVLIVVPAAGRDQPGCASSWGNAANVARPDRATGRSITKDGGVKSTRSVPPVTVD